MKTFICLAFLTACFVQLKAQQAREITWFEPSSGMPGTQVVISATGLKTTDPSTQVFFNGVPASIVKKKADHLVVEVPEGSVSGPIRIKDATGELLTSTNFSIPINAAQRIAVQETQQQIPAAGMAKPAVPLSAPVAAVAKTAVPLPLVASAAEVLEKPLPQAPIPVASKTAVTVPVAAPETQARHTAIALKPEPVLVASASSSKTRVALATASISGAASAKPVTITAPVIAPAKPAILITKSQAPVATAPADDNKPVVDNGKLPQSNVNAHPLILSFEPRNGPAGTQVKISGLNFGFDKSNVSVTVKNSAALTITSVYDQTIEVTIPPGYHDSGSLVVVVNGKKSVSRESFHTL